MTGMECWMFSSKCSFLLWVLFNVVPLIVAVFSIPEKFRLVLLGFSIFLWTMVFAWTWTVFLLRRSGLPSRTEQFARLVIFATLLLVCVPEFGYVFIWAHYFQVPKLVLAVVGFLLELSLIIHYALYPTKLFSVTFFFVIADTGSGQQSPVEMVRQTETSAGGRLLGEPEQCSVCMDRPVDVITSCSHKFCSQCINSGFVGPCPVCRQNISYISELQLYVNA